MNFDLVNAIFMGIFGLFGGLSAIFLGVRYFVCLVRTERRDPWSFPLALGWLMLFLSVFIPPRVTDVLYELNRPSVVASEAFITVATLAWCWAMVAYVWTILDWQRRPQN